MRMTALVQRTSWVLMLAALACKPATLDDTSRSLTSADTGSGNVVAAQPTLTVASIKRFVFDWTDVPDATHYRLLEQVEPGQDFVQIGADVPSGVESYAVVVPLYDRTKARYRLQSCDALECVDSDDVEVTGTLVDAVGYVKSADPGVRDRFGASLALSRDGRTLAVGVPFEDGGDTDLEGDPLDDSALDAGAVFVYTRGADGHWGSDPVYVKANNAEATDYFGFSTALSADGDTLVVGAPGEGGAGLNGASNERPDSGAVYVYERDELGAWSDAFYIKASTTSEYVGTGDAFGKRVAISADGSTLAVSAPDEDGAATNVDGDQGATTEADAGAVYVFRRDGDGIWLGDPTYVKAHNPERGDYFGSSIALSASGDVLAVGAPSEDGAGLTGASNDAESSGAAYVYTRGPDGAWSNAFYLKSSTEAALNGEYDRFGSSVALSADGTVLAVGAPSESSGATGVDGDRADDSASLAGAVFVFTADGEGLWGSTPVYLKASQVDTGDRFGSSVSLSDDGQTLAVGVPEEDGRGVGVGSPEDNSTPESGAAYVFRRSEQGWAQLAYVKPTHSSITANHGSSVVLSGDGNTLAVGAPSEWGRSPGIGGDPADLSADRSGAVYLY